MIIKIAIPPTKPEIIRTVIMRERNKIQKKTSDAQYRVPNPGGNFIRYFFCSGTPEVKQMNAVRLLKPHWLRSAQKDLPGFQWLNITRLLIFPSVNGRSEVGQKALDMFSCR